MKNISENIIIQETLNIIYQYINNNYSDKEIKKINKELNVLCDISKVKFSKTESIGYETAQKMLSSINEKEKIRKIKGVYYTPHDLIRFIAINTIKLHFGILNNNNLHVLDLNGVPYRKFCFEKTLFDPTCGAGEFLLVAAELKFDVLELHRKNITNGNIKNILSTIYGNDVNPESTLIAQLRLFLFVLNRYGAEKIRGISSILLANFYCYDFITSPNENDKYDLIVGNPPYVEDTKSGLSLNKRYGNIYANTLENSSLKVNNLGVIGFVIPLSYISTPRMKEIRTVINENMNEQYILSYSDRPDSLFVSVHQKLCVIFAKKDSKYPALYTGNYQYWYKDEREALFDNTMSYKNNFAETKFIPKLGTELDSKIYEKIINNEKSLLSKMKSGDASIFLNMRAAFWIKAFMNFHEGSEYKEYKVNKEAKYFIMCLLNSSLFWWHWIAVSDCWHITMKELENFKIPNKIKYSDFKGLAIELEQKLEETKLYVGTKQTEYEYKHKECIDIIHEIDDIINKSFNLTEEESIYIKNFALRYRIGGGAK
ncbi:Eco57I restriction-modification methylase domain-containing protein [Helcococcus massiliensis]|uniref:Eco57I restriction-modification methylase domain-containing protein n=1 Tax=Helcococcus massiliensis TaxID=2040290 RepID=UPI0013564882|nr:Eco57I restriction-modification methylase domain-containing protein [Helcococcus massiliensis]